MQAEDLLTNAHPVAADRYDATTDAYDELVKAYDFYNERLFNGELPGCLFTFQRKKRTLGYFSDKRFIHKTGEKVDEIAMNPSVFAVSPVEGVLSTLVHECAHQWQARFGSPGRRGYHNAEWAEKMESIGLIPSNTGRPGGKKVGEQMCHYIDPNGRFMRLTKELLESGFALSWYDRFPSASDLPIYVGEDREEDLLTDSSPVELGAPAGHEELEGVNDAKPGQVLQVGSLSDPPSKNGLDLALPGDESVKSPTVTRAKFICPECSDAAWGKPSLSLVCGKCNVPFGKL